MKPELRHYLAELRSALDRQPGRPPLGQQLRRAEEIPLVWPSVEFPPGRSMAEQFEAAIAPWGGVVHHLASAADLLPTLARLIQEAGARRVSRWRTPRLDALHLEEGLAPLGLEWVMPSLERAGELDDVEARRRFFLEMEGIEVGLTDCDVAVAHTGTLVVRHDPSRPAFTNLLPWTNLIVVNASQLVPTLADAVAGLARDQAGEPWPSNLIFNTGPSRSGDIDLTVGQGAAGPGSWHVLLVRDGEPALAPGGPT